LLNEPFRRQPSSFRDPSGFLFWNNGVLYRQINSVYKDEYDFLISSGLYDHLLNSNLIIPHVESDSLAHNPKTMYKIIQPEIIPFISYPYEWSFTQLKQAALCTLEIQKIAMNFNMTLKDSSAYNIQFKNCKPILIDTLSFEKYHEGQPWSAYKQFCQHFLAPLALMSKKDIRLSQLLRIYIDGIPLDLADKLLPTRALSSFSLISHIHFHAKSQKHYENKNAKVKERKVSRRSMTGIIESLISGIKKLNWTPEGTEWANYYDDINYSHKGFEHKKQIVSTIIEKIKPKFLWDLGANMGEFSRITSDKKIETIAFDVDPSAVEKNFLECIKKNETKILPLLLDLTNPSPSIGWNNVERHSLIERGPVDTVMALALIHHLTISNNLPLNKVSEFFEKICHHLIIEFIPKTDSQVKRLLLNREDIFPNYNQENFEKEFSNNFKIIESFNIQESERVIYHMEKLSIT